MTAYRHPGAYRQCNGNLTVNNSTMTVTGSLTNFNSSTNTLSSGTYTVGGTFGFTGANIVNNAANLTLTGTSAKILNGTTNGLANFANNTGTFTLSGNAKLPAQPISQTPAPPSSPTEVR